MKNLFEFEEKNLTKELTSICQSFNGVEFWSANEIMPILGKNSFYDYSETLFYAMKQCKEEGFSCDDHFFSTIIDVYVSKYGLYLILQMTHNINERINDPRIKFEELVKESTPLKSPQKKQLLIIQKNEIEENISLHTPHKRVGTIIVDSNKLVDSVKKYRLSINEVDFWSVSKLLNGICSNNISQVRELLKLAVLKCKKEGTCYDKHFMPFLFDIFVDQYGLFLLIVSLCKNTEVVENLYSLGVKRYPNDTNDFLPQININSNAFFLQRGEKVVLKSGIKGKQHQLDGEVFTVRIHNYSHGVALIEEGDNIYSRFEVTPLQQLF